MSARARRTDVAQTNARLQEGISDYAQAVADLNQAIATYIQVIGHRPETSAGTTASSSFCRGPWMPAWRWR